MNTPTCPLCSGPLVREENVYVGTHITEENVAYNFAWVCRHCSSAFPIAIVGGGLFTSASPLYQNGERQSG